jgi:hypothetical protein
MKTRAVWAALALACSVAAPAGAIEVFAGTAAVAPYPDLAPLGVRSVAFAALLPELPEPDVVAMMLLGLVLIGYRASRDSDEKFTPM